jgi:hypothetical protein
VTKLEQVAGHPLAERIRRELHLKEIVVEWFCQECFWRLIRAHPAFGRKCVINVGDLAEALGYDAADVTAFRAWKKQRIGLI